MAIRSSALEILGIDDCRDLLRGATIGRLALSSGALPVVFPVNYVMTDEAILIRTDEGTKLTGARQGAVVAFEIDDYDTTTRTGWSVLVQGMLRELCGPAELAEARRLDLAPWAPMETGAFVSISCDVISGRRIGGWHPLSELPVVPRADH